MSYAHAGNVLHECMEEYYEGRIKDIELMKKEFNKRWKAKKLDESHLKDRSDEWWMMVINGMQLDLDITSTELKIFYPDIVGYIDALNTDKDEIRDWKSSKRGPWNEEEYKLQLKLYSWLYFRRFNRIPTKAVVEYLRYTGTNKGELSFVPTEADLLEAEQWHFGIREKMNKIVEEQKVPESGPCQMYCPYKNLDPNSNGDILTYDIHNLGHNLQIDGKVDNAINTVFDKKFSYELKNAYFMKKAKPNINTTIKFWNPGKRQLPIGFLDGVKKTLSDYGKKFGKEVVVNLKDNRLFDDTKVAMPDKFLNGIELRDYQEEAVKSFIKNKIGILQLATGSGKTEIAIETIRQIGVKTLFVVDKIELLKQTKKRLEEALGIPIGQIGQGVHDEQDVTVATIQTLTKTIRLFAPYLSTIRYVIFDETHKVAARSYFTLSKYLRNTEYRLGISGTAFRDDGNDMMIEAIVGKVKYDLNSKTLIDKGWLIKPTIQFIKNYISKDNIKAVEREISKGLINETALYPVYYKAFVAESVERDRAITHIVGKHMGKKILILTKLVDHGKNLESILDGSKHLYGATSKKEREKIFKEFVDGDLDILISTISIFAEGIDIPKLDVVINASANRGDIKSIQVLGRVIRILQGKKDAYYIDFDDPVEFLQVASLARKKAFRKEGHDVEVIDYEEYKRSK